MYDDLTPDSNGRGGRLEVGIVADIGSREIPEASGCDSRTRILSKLDQVRVEILNRWQWVLQFIYLVLDYTWSIFRRNLETMGRLN
jgi:hypothetical protein